VKKLVSPGVTLIVSQPAFTTSSRHDPWGAHSAGRPIFNPEYCASGRWIIYFNDDLLDGNNYYYPLKFLDDFLGWTEFQNFMVSYVTWDGITNAQGETYNYVVRAWPFDKILAADWTAWLAAH
jgi:hypothetical protein